jgi:hypothetical protein
MGRIFKDKFTTMLETIILCVVVSIVLTGVYIHAWSHISLSKQMSSLVSILVLDNVTEGKLLPLPSKDVSSSVSANQCFVLLSSA